MDYIKKTLDDSSANIRSAIDTCIGSIQASIEASIECCQNGGILYFAGNGGSAADASHIASELVGSFESYRHPLPAISLATDISILTSVSNDFTYDKVFLQQARGLVRKNDLLWLISTSGNSKNLILAAKWANENGIKTVGLLGPEGGELKSLVNIPILATGNNPQRIQEVHIVILHILASGLKSEFPDGINQS